MPETRYDLYINGNPEAENMTLDNAVLLLKAIFSTYFDEALMTGTEVSIKARKDNAYA